MFTAATKSVLQEAVDMYCSSEARVGGARAEAFRSSRWAPNLLPSFRQGKAKAIYGHIASWNVAKVTDMSSGKGTFHQLAARRPSW